ncbi:TPA: hypothetical protein ACXM68_001135 [Pseudomonas aeruginosa]
MRALPVELERRIALLAKEENQGADLDGITWFWIILLGAIFPLAIAVWGWS